jgi:hypothetical protein
MVPLWPAFRLEARVVAADTGEPVGGARVDFLRFDGSESFPDSVLSAPDGRFAIDDLALEVPYELRLLAPDFAPLVWSINARVGSADREHEIRLPRGVPIAGRVVDFQSGVGLAGARVGELLSDAEGRFEGRIQPQPGGAWLQFTVTAPDYAGLIVAGTLESLATVEEFRLPRPAWIEGTLRSREGTAIGDGYVEYWYSKPGVVPCEPVEPVETSPLYEVPEGWHYFLEPSSASADAEGRYRLAVLPWAIGWITAYAPGFENDGFAWRATAAPGGVQTLDWALQAGEVRPTRVTGRVLLNSEHWDLSGVLTWKGSAKSGLVRMPKATFEFEVEPGELELVAELTAFPGVPSAPVRVRLGPNETRFVQLEVRVPELTIAGRVEHADGSPASDVELLGYNKLEAATIGRSTRSQRDGEYRLRVPDLGSKWTVACSAGNSERLEREAEAGATGVDFVVPNVRALRVRVRDGRTGEVLGRDVGHQVLVRTSAEGFRRLDPLDEQPDPSGYTEFAVLESSLDVLVLPEPELFPTYAPVWRAAVEPGAGALDFVLAPGIALELERASDSEPLSSEHELYLVEDYLQGSLSRSDWLEDSPLAGFAKRRRVAFDAAGHARLEGLAPGPVHFRLFPNDHFVTPATFLLDPGQPPIEVHWQPQ